VTDKFVCVSPEDVLARPLMDGLFHEYDTRYGADFPEVATSEMGGFPTERFLPPDGALLLLLRDGVTIAGGAFMRFDPYTAEFKRIWTSENFRRQGLGRKVLEALEARARDSGYSRVFLTSGFRQPEAHALYLRCGYTPLYDTAESPRRYGVLPFVKALGPQAQPLDAGLRWARRLDDLLPE